MHFISFQHWFLLSLKSSTYTTGGALTIKFIEPKWCGLRGVPNHRNTIPSLKNIKPSPVSRPKPSPTVSRPKPSPNKYAEKKQTNANSKQ